MRSARLQLSIDALGVALRALLAITFIWACIHKISNPYDFSLQVATYQILPLSLINLQGVILPWIELVVAAALIAGFWTRASALVTCGMNVMFIVAIALALSADLQLQCGCFASADVADQMSSSLIVRDVGLLLAGALLVYMKPDRLTVDRWLMRRKSNA